MAKGRISMRKIKEILRMGYENGISMNRIAICCSVGRSTVQDYFRRLKVAGLSWPISEEMTEEALEKKLFPEEISGIRDHEPLNYEYLVQEMRRPNVTLALLWEEYKQNHPNGYQYSQFCNLVRQYRKTMNYSMRQEHKAGEKTFVDFGEGLKIVDTKTGEKIPTKLFVSVWGASTFTFAKAVLGEDLSNWIDVNVSALEYFGCCPKAIVPDNTRAAVSKACRYEPEINPTYAEFARHYGVVIFPARPYRPKDKPKVENAVKLAKRWILAKLRDRIFHSVGELNEAILILLKVFNNKQMKRLKKSRQELFETLDKPNAQLLSDKRYEFAEWKTVRVNIDYHVGFDDHYYSVPYTLIRQQLETRATRNMIEIFKKGERVCSYQRSYQKHKYTTRHEHMPPSHQQYAEWTPSRIMVWATKYGAAVKALVERIMQTRKFPEQGYRSCLGIIRLANRYPPERLNDACQRALEYRAESYQSVKNILLNNLDRLKTKNNGQKTFVIQHKNIRGAEYYLSDERKGQNEGISKYALSTENAYKRVPAPCLEKGKLQNGGQTELALI